MLVFKKSLPTLKWMFMMIKQWGGFNSGCRQPLLTSSLWAANNSSSATWSSLYWFQRRTVISVCSVAWACSWLSITGSVGRGCCAEAGTTRDLEERACIQIPGQVRASGHRRESLLHFFICNVDLLIPTLQVIGKIRWDKLPQSPVAGT